MKKSEIAKKNIKLKIDGESILVKAPFFGEAIYSGGYTPESALHDYLEDIENYAMCVETEGCVKT